MILDKDDLLLILATIIIIALSALSSQAKAADVSASYSNSSFEEIFHVDRLDSIKMWEQPKTQYTPKNLRTEQQMRFSGKEGTNSYNSYTFHLTDYDTKIVKSYFKDGKFFVEDNTGKVFQTGALQEVDTSKIETTINNNTNRINQNTQVIHTNTSNINALKNDVSKLNTRVDGLQSQINKLDDRLERGLATVTALTSLHPNPRFKGKTQVAIGSGVYNNNVAGAVGIFHYVNDNVMVSIGASYGGSSSWAGNVGLSIGF